VSSNFCATCKTRTPLNLPRHNAVWGKQAAGKAMGIGKMMLVGLHFWKIGEPI
jgi:hypothetical protein